MYIPDIKSPGQSSRRAIPDLEGERKLR